MYGGPARLEQLPWGEVRDQLVGADVYWVVASANRTPHPRPVWGIWLDDALLLSIGSPVVLRAVRTAPDVAVHVGGATDVVIVTGHADVLDAGYGDDAADMARVLAVYDEKYEWDYSIEEYGPLTLVAPREVIAWRSEGWAGRDGFRRGGRWVFPPVTGAS